MRSLFFGFKNSVDRYKGNYRVRTFDGRQHFYVMGFAQLTYRESLRDIETCLQALSGKLCHSVIRQPVAKSTLAEANMFRNRSLFYL